MRFPGPLTLTWFMMMLWVLFLTSHNDEKKRGWVSQTTQGGQCGTRAQLLAASCETCCDMTHTIGHEYGLRTWWFWAENPQGQLKFTELPARRSALVRSPPYPSVPSSPHALTC